MKAGEFKKLWLRKGVLEFVGVIAIGEDFWYHIHDIEELPEDLTIALHPRVRQAPTKRVKTVKPNLRLS